jgi:hypothetical protein
LEGQGWEASVIASRDPWALLRLREQQDVA